MSKPFLYDAVNFLFYGVMENMPEWLREREMSSAFVLGGGGIYGVVRGLQWLSKNVADKVVPGFDKKVLPVLEKICIAGMALAPVVYGLIEPEGAKQLVAQHPVYTAGMGGVYAGSIVGAAQDLVKRSKERALEERV